MKKILVILICVIFSGNLYASEIAIDGVPWISQLDTINEMGTDWDSTMNCGPTSVVILSGYSRCFTPTTKKIKKFDDWLVDNGLVSSINNYNLPKDGVGHWTLRSGMAYYFGLWNSYYYRTITTTKNYQINLIRDSILKGSPSIIGVKTKMSTSGASHWMVAIGLKDTNEDGDYIDDADEVLVSDPGRSSEYFLNGTGKGRKWYTISAFKAVLFGTIIFEDTYDVGEYDDLYLWHNEDEYSDWDYNIFQYRPSQPFVDYFLNAGVGSESQISGVALFGVPINNVHLFPVGFVNNNYAITQTWIQNYFNAATEDNYVFVYNPKTTADNSIYDGSVFSVHGKIREYWEENYWFLGYPACNEYNEVIDGYTYVIQWFIDGNSDIFPVAYNTETGKFDENVIYNLDPGERIQQHVNVNCGYSKEGFGMGGGGEDEFEQPQSNFTTNTTNGEPPLTVYFTNTSTSPNGDIVSYEWDFKDGSMSGLENPSHVFLEAGEYNVSLTVTDEVGESDIFTSQINVSTCSTCGPCDNIGISSSMTGDLFQTNTYNIASQKDLKLAKLNGANKIAVVWESSSQDGSNDTVVTKLIDLDALAINSEEIVNTFTEDAQGKPKILATSDGYLIAWESRYQDGDGVGVFAQFFDNNAKKIGGEFQVNTYVNNYQRDIALAGNPNYNNIIVVWESDEQDGDDEGIYAQLYNQNTKEKVGGEFRVNTIVVSDQEAPSVVINPNNGNFFIVWSSLINNDERNIIFQEIDQNGNKVGGEITVASNSDYKFDSQIIITDSNEIIVAWRAWQISTGYDPYDIFAQVLNINTKEKIGNSLQVNTCSDIKVLDYELKAIPGGDDYIIVYESQDTYNGQNDIYYQKFDVDGGTYGNIVKVSNEVGDQMIPGVTFLDGNRYIVYFHSDHEENEESSNNVYLQGFGIDFSSIMSYPRITEIEYN